MDFCLVSLQLEQLSSVYVNEDGTFERSGYVAAEIETKYHYSSQQPMLQYLIDKHFRGGKQPTSFPEEHGVVHVKAFLQNVEPTGGLIIGTMLSDPEQDCISRLARICGGLDNITMDYKVYLYPVGPHTYDPSIKIKKHDQKLRMISRHNETMVGVECSFDFPGDLWEAWRQNGHDPCFGILVNLKINDKAVELLHLDGAKNPFGFYKKLLDDGSLSDAVIISGDGAEIKCHKAILVAHSPVFKAMFESNMIEGATSRFKMPEMTEDGVRALLAYLYHRGIIQASKCCSIAFQLLVAADKYIIPDLTDSIHALILSKDHTWFDDGVDQEMYNFALTKQETGVDQTESKKFEEIGFKTSVAIKRKRPFRLEDCPEYQELFKKNPELAIKRAKTDNAWSSWVKFANF